MSTIRSEVNFSEVPKDLQWIEERSEHELSFNVMPGKRVREVCAVKGYEVGIGFARAHFTRDYMSEMRDSPDHYIFLTSQVQCQKLIYVYLCWRFGLPYEPEGREIMKIWATDVTCRMSSLVADKFLTQEFQVNRLHYRGVKDGRGRVDIDLLGYTPGKEIIIVATAVTYFAAEVYATFEALGYDR